MNDLVHFDEGAKTSFAWHTSNAIYDIVEEIAAASGKSKTALLQKYLPNSNLLDYLRMALDPFTTYGVKQLPKTTGSGPESAAFGPSTFKLLQDLKSRHLTGNAAKAAIEAELSKLSEKSSTLLRRILTKNLRAGFSAKSVNQVIPGAIFLFECMLAQKFEAKRIKVFPVAGELKYDGVRCIAIYKEGETKLYSRTGNEFDSFPALCREITRVIEGDARIPSKSGTPYKEDMVIDGEIMAASEKFNEIVGDVHKKNANIEDATFMAFELMTAHEFSNGNMTPYSIRRARLERFVKEANSTLLKMSSAWMFNSHEEIAAKQEELLAAGQEGLIIKPLDGVYECKRSYYWLKVKDKVTVDVLIVDVEPGSADSKREGLLGAFVVDFEGRADSVGSGITDDMLMPVEEARKAYVGRMIEVEYHQKTPDGFMRHARFKRFRDDKPVEDGVGV